MSRILWYAASVDIHQGASLRTLLRTAAAVAVLLAASVSAQTKPDVVVMRRVIAPPAPKASGPKLTPGAVRRCDVPPEDTTIVNYGAYYDIGDASSVAGAHALCEKSSIVEQRGPTGASPIC